MSLDISLSQQHCQPCEGEDKPLTREEALKLLDQVPEWKLSIDAKIIHRQWTIKNFRAAVEFINSITELAELENHHPDIHLTGYRNLRIDLSTHAINGLSANDFILAAKINELPVQIKKQTNLSQG